MTVHMKWCAQLSMMQKKQWKACEEFSDIWIFECERSKANMKILANTGKMTREEWLKWRTKGIGGSDVSVIAGMNKFRSVFQLWLEKTGQVIPEEKETDFTHFGTVLEP